MNNSTNYGKGAVAASIGLSEATVNSNRAGRALTLQSSYNGFQFRVWKKGYGEYNLPEMENSTDYDYDADMKVL